MTGPKKPFDHTSWQNHSTVKILKKMVKNKESELRVQPSIMNIQRELLWNWYLADDYCEVLNLPFTASRKRRRKRSSHKRLVRFYYKLCRQLFMTEALFCHIFAFPYYAKGSYKKWPTEGVNIYWQKLNAPLLNTNRKIVLSYIQCYLLGLSKACLYSM